MEPIARDPLTTKPKASLHDVYYFASGDPNSVKILFGILKIGMI